MKTFKCFIHESVNAQNNKRYKDETQWITVYWCMMSIEWKIKYIYYYCWYIIYECIEVVNPTYSYIYDKLSVFKQERIYLNLMWYFV